MQQVYFRWDQQKLRDELLDQTIDDIFITLLAAGLIQKYWQSHPQGLIQGGGGGMGV